MKELNRCSALRQAGVHTKHVQLEDFAILFCKQMQGPDRNLTIESSDVPEERDSWGLRNWSSHFSSQCQVIIQRYKWSVLI
jgi:hypothetical protein